MSPKYWFLTCPKSLNSIMSHCSLLSSVWFKTQNNKLRQLSHYSADHLGIDNRSSIQRAIASPPSCFSFNTLKATSCSFIFPSLYCDASHTTNKPRPITIIIKGLPRIGSLSTRWSVHDHHLWASVVVSLHKWLYFHPRSSASSAPNKTGYNHTSHSGQYNLCGL